MILCIALPTCTHPWSDRPWHACMGCCVSNKGGMAMVAWREKIKTSNHDGEKLHDGTWSAWRLLANTVAMFDTIKSKRLKIFEVQTTVNSTFILRARWDAERAGWNSEEERPEFKLTILSIQCSLCVCCSICLHVLLKPGLEDLTLFYTGIELAEELLCSRPWWWLIPVNVRMKTKLEWGTYKWYRKVDHWTSLEDLDHKHRH